MFLFHRSATCALTVTLVTLSCGLAARAQVGVTQPATVAPVGVAPTDKVAGVTSAPVTGAAPVKTTPVTGAATVTTKAAPGAAPVKTPVVGAAAVGALGGVKASGVNTGLLLLLSQIADGQITMDAAWDKGLLDASKVLQLLSQTQRLTEDTRNETLQRDLAGSLVRLAPATVATPQQLSARVRVALCRYYSSIGDERVVPLCEALITEKLDGKQVKQPLSSNPDGGSSSLYLSSVITLAQYYERVEQWQKAGQTWERALGFWQDANWWQASVRIEAARAYTLLSQDDKVQTLYSQVAQYGDGWFTGIAYWDRANLLFDKGRYEDTVSLLKKLIPKVDNPPMRVVLLKTMAQASLIGGKLPEAAQYARSSLDEFARLSDPESNLGVAQQASGARDILEQVKMWESRPIIPEARTVAIVHPSTKQIKTPRKITLKVFTFGDTPIVATSSSSGVQALIAKEGKRGEINGHKCYEREILISAGHTAFDSTSSVVLTLQSPDSPDFSVQIELALESPIK